MALAAWLVSVVLMVPLGVQAAPAAPGSAPAAPGSAPTIAPVPQGGRPRVVLVGPHGGVCAALTAAGPELGLQVECPTDAALGAGEIELAGAAVVFLQHLRADLRARLDADLVAARAGGTLVLALSAGAGGELEALRRAGGPLEDAEVLADYASGEPARLVRLLRWVAARHLGRGALPAPVPSAPVLGLFHPDAPARFATVAEYRAWAQANGRADPQRPLLVVAVHALHLSLQQPAVVAALVRAAEAQGARALAVVDGLPSYPEHLKALAPDVMVHPCHSNDPVDLRIELGVAHLHGIFFRGPSIAAWQAAEAGPGPAAHRTFHEGLSPHEVAFHVGSQELIGGIEPQVVAGTEQGGGSSEALTPIAERVDHLVRRALGWARLRRRPAGQKRVAIVYYDREQGQAELMRGSATGQMLNGPRSLLRVLERLANEGYAVHDRPTDEAALLDRMRDHGRRVGAWNPALLDRLARSGHAALVPLSQYQAWYTAAVPPARRAELEARWGPPPGDLMVWHGSPGGTSGAGEPHLVIPQVSLGNVVLLPQPLRGEADDPQLLHDTRVPPTHAYLATYFWLQRGFKADAVVHFGTHGSEFALPGKGVGLAHGDWPDVIMGALPNLTPWVINNLGESVPARRRAYAVLLGHLVPPSARAGLSDALENLHSDLERWRSLEPGALRQRFQVEISGQIRALRLDDEVARAAPRPPGSPPPTGDTPAPGADPGPLPDATLDAVDAYLHLLAEETVHTELHVLGEAPATDRLVPYLALCLGARFASALAPLLPRSRSTGAHRSQAPAPQGQRAGRAHQGQSAEAEHQDRAASHAAVEALIDGVVRQRLSPAEALRSLGVTARPLPPAVRDGLEQLTRLVDGFARTHQELDHLVLGLAGGFIPPGPANSPTRNPAVVPTGRNLYVVNPEEIPARASWDLAAGLVDDLLAAERARTGAWPEQVGFHLNPFSSLQDYGVTEAQILRLIGVEPVWDAANRVQRVEVVPRARLGRPRVDVFIAIGGYYRDILPTRLALLDRAIRAAAAAPEADNPLAAANRTVRAQLEAGGLAPEAAAAQSQARIFGDPPGEYGDMTYYYLLERSGDWDNLGELMQRYVRRQSHAYTEGAWGVSAQAAYEQHMVGTSLVLRAWSDSTRSPLNNKYMWLRGGSLAAAVAHVTGVRPQYLLTDVRDVDRARMVSAESAVRADTRVRLFNPEFIKGMMREGYAGADQLAVHVSNTLGWQVFQPEAIDDGVWNEIVETYVRDRHRLGLKAFFAAQNPHAFQELTATALEAARKGYWNADPQTLAEVSRAYAESVVAHGPNGGLRDGPNLKLAAAVAAALRATDAPTDAALAEAVSQALAAQRAPAAAPGQAAAPGPAPGAATAPNVATAANPAPAPGPAPGAPSAQNAPMPAPTDPAEARPEAAGEPPAAAAERAEVEGPRLEAATAGPPVRLPWILAGVVLLLLGLGFVRGRRGGDR